MIYLPYLYVHKRRKLSILCFLWQLKFFLNLIPTGYLGGKCLKVLVKDTLVFFFFQFESLLTWKNFSRVNIQCKSSSVSELFLCHLLFLHWLLDSRVAVTVERGPFREDRAAAHTATPWCWPPESLAELLPGGEKIFLSLLGSWAVTFFLLETQGRSLPVGICIYIEWYVHESSILVRFPFINFHRSCCSLALKI